jgi:S1-C subfamily serine protease
MHIFIKAVVFVLSAYLSLTNTFATFIGHTFSLEKPPTTQIQTTNTIVKLPSVLGTAIPDILLHNSDYQQAAVGAAAGLTGSTTNDTLSALVNIFCTFKTKDYIRTTTGSGFFIDPDGVIMTNAHIAQFLLLEKTDSFGDAHCTVRTGSPAVAKYTAELLYISPAWVQKNAAEIQSNAPMGTGERDYALLYVSSDIEGKPLPKQFPSLSFNSKLLPISTRNHQVTAAGYPATDLVAHGPTTALISRIAKTSVSELYTFGSNYADVIAIRGSEVGAEGASGGPIVDSDGKVIGMIATRGDDTADGAGSLRAITLSHIDRTIKEETGFTLAENLNGDLPYRAKIFADTLTPFLIQLLEQAKTSQ